MAVTANDAPAVCFIKLLRVDTVILQVKFVFQPTPEGKKAYFTMNLLPVAIYDTDLASLTRYLPRNPPRWSSVPVGIDLPGHEKEVIEDYFNY